MIKINKKSTKIIIFIVAIIAVVMFLLAPKKRGLSPQDFTLSKAKTGNIIYQVDASGTINPVNTVIVGTQVSGMVEKVLADYNDDVKEGQVLALLDSVTLKETMDKSFASLEYSKAKELQAKLNYERIKKLYEEKLTSLSSLETAEVEYKETSANVLSATADYNIAQRNYSYATITSPVSGTIISKEIEQGQTVAASYSTPTLFEVAEDLSKMQIEADISEADIGYIKEGMKSTFSVDAYPEETFNGTVRQVRLSPTEESSVVMYTVIIEIDNSDRKLLPGMTASVSINAKEVNDVVLISAMALQYKPTTELKGGMDVQKIDNVGINQAIVYVLERGRLIPKIITKGLSDMTNIEIKEGLEVGDEVIIEANSNGSKPKGRP